MKRVGTRGVALTLASVAATAVALAHVPTATAADCSYGDARALVQASIVFHAQRARGIDSGATQRLGACSYSLFAPGLATFTSRQYFVGGINYSWDYPDLGLTRDQAATDLGLIQDHVYVVPANDLWEYDLNLPPYEQPLLRSLRDAVVPGVGQLVVLQKDVILHLPLGHWVSVWTAEYPGNPILQALHPDNPEWVAMFSAFAISVEVRLDIVP